MYQKTDAQLNKGIMSVQLTENRTGRSLAYLAGTVNDWPLTIVQEKESRSKSRS